MPQKDLSLKEKIAILNQVKLLPPGTSQPLYFKTKIQLKSN
jgi:hypothetical protein